MKLIITALTTKYTINTSLSHGLKISLLCFLFSSISFSLWAQKNKIPYHLLDKQPNGLFYQRNTIAPFSGVAISENADGKKLMEVRFKDGKMHGDVKEWGKNGKKIFEATFENGVQVGKETQWYASGALKSEFNYVNGQFQGICTEWYKKKEQKRSQGLFKNGQEEGEHKWWYSTGEIDQIVFFKNGLAEGTVKNWHQNGKLKLESAYTSGKKNGLTTEWYDNGQKMTEANFTNDKEDGTVNFWSKKGYLEAIQEYKNGVLTKDINYRSGSIYTGKGYIQVYNGSESFYQVEITGKEKERPYDAKEIIYIVDGMLLQLITSPVSEFAKTDKSESELLKEYSAFEEAYIEKMTASSIDIKSASGKTASGKEYLYWEFVSPSSKEKVQKARTIQEEHYLSVICNKQVLSLYAIVTNSDEPQDVKAMLKRIADTIKVDKNRIDLNALIR